MRHTLGYSIFGTPEMELNSAFNVAIAYEDFESGKHAKRTCDLLVKNLGPACRCSNQMWKFDVLNIPKLREIATKDAVGADVLIVSVSGMNDISDGVKAWFEEWIGQARLIAVVGLFNRTDETKAGWTSVRSYLAELAKRAGTEFFAQPDDESVELEPAQLLRSRAAQSPTASSELYVLPNPEYRETVSPRWGINE